MSTGRLSLWAQFKRLPLDSIAAVAATVFMALIVAGAFSRVPW